MGTFKIHEGRESAVLGMHGPPIGYVEDGGVVTSPGGIVSGPRQLGVVDQEGRVFEESRGRLSEIGRVTDSGEVFRQGTRDRKPSLLGHVDKYGSIYLGSRRNQVAHVSSSSSGDPSGVSIVHAGGAALLLLEGQLEPSDSTRAMLAGVAGAVAADVLSERSVEKNKYSGGSRAPSSNQSTQASTSYAGGDSKAGCGLLLTPIVVLLMVLWGLKGAYNAATGWLSPDSEPVAQEVELPSEVRFTKSRVNLRSCPSTECRVRMTLPAGMKVKVGNYADGWWEYIVWGSGTGYISDQVLTAEEPQGR